MFSIANTVQVYTCKDNEKNAFEMSMDKIQEKIKDNNQGNQYEPQSIDTLGINFDHGTKIVLSGFRSQHNKTDRYIKTQIARRFSIIGDNFEVTVNKQKITPEDRNYHNRIQFLWTYSPQDKAQAVVALCKNKAQHEDRHHELNSEQTLKIEGWIGSVKESGQMKDKDNESDNLNRIAIFMRGKMAQQDLLKDFNEHGVYASYLIGELYVEDLDNDNKSDAATSNRQGIQEDDERYLELKKRLKKELKHIQSQWSSHRITEGAREAEEIPAIKDWLEGKKGDSKKSAQRSLGKINTLKVEPKMKRELFKYAIIAHEHFEAKEQLSSLENVDPSNLEAVLTIFNSFDALEHSLYGEIVKQRLGVLQEIEEKINKNDYEKVIQQYLFDHLWLLDPHWERGTEIIETGIEKAFKTIDEELTDEQKKGRLDIGYRQVAGKYVIVELKRPDVCVSTAEATEQMDKYTDTMQNVLKKTQDPHTSQTPIIESILLVGKDLKDWKNADGAKKRSLDTFEARNMRVVFYEQLIKDAKNRYQHYLEAQKDVNGIQKILEAIDNFVPEK